jgi:hypothetical protein
VSEEPNLRLPLSRWDLALDLPGLQAFPEGVPKDQIKLLSNRTL